MSETKPLFFLLKLAWDCRYRLPALIALGFMIFDVRMQLDINVQMRQIPRPRPERAVDEEAELSHADDDDSSWTTFEEQELSEDSLE